MSSPAPAGLLIAVVVLSCFIISILFISNFVSSYFSVLAIHTLLQF